MLFFGVVKVNIAIERPVSDMGSGCGAWWKLRVGTLS